MFRHVLTAAIEESHGSPETENPQPYVPFFSVRLGNVIETINTGNITSGSPSNEFGLLRRWYFYPSAAFPFAPFRHLLQSLSSTI